MLNAFLKNADVFKPTFVSGISLVLIYNFEFIYCNKNKFISGNLLVLTLSL
jgi:hypothetical protein